MSGSDNIGDFLHNLHCTSATAHCRGCFSVCSTLRFILSRQRCRSYTCSAVIKSFHSVVASDLRHFLWLTTSYITTATCRRKVTPSHALLVPLCIASMQRTVSVSSVGRVLWSLVAQLRHSARSIVNRFRSKKPSMCILRHKSMGLNVTLNRTAHTCAFSDMWRTLFWPAK